MKEKERAWKMILKSCPVKGVREMVVTLRWEATLTAEGSPFDYQGKAKKKTSEALTSF